MAAFIDLTGNRYGKLLVIKRHGSISNRPAWLCKCDCGVIVTVKSENLKSGNTKSCGCYKVEIIRNAGMANVTHGYAKRIDGKKSKIYSIWDSMRQRCNNENNCNYENYGLRGIKVCEEWNKSFEAFLKDMGIPSEGFSIDRINNDGNYEPSNCRWATRSQQRRNRRDFNEVQR